MPPRRELPEVTVAGPLGGALLQLLDDLPLPRAAAADADRWQLVASAGALELVAPKSIGPMALALQCHTGPLARRLRGARRDEPLGRAFGLHRRTEAAPSVVDATAGLCRDAMLLAVWGCRVTALERVAALCALVRAAIHGAPFAARLAVRCVDAVEWLASLTEADRPDAVYLDPMFEAPGKAQVKKDMQICRLLAGPPDDPAPLFAAALGACRERVVVKRHPGAEPLGGPPAFQVAGERVRFDVYLRATAVGGDASPPAAP